MYGEYSKRPLIALKIICACYISGKQTFKIVFVFFKRLCFLKYTFIEYLAYATLIHKKVFCLGISIASPICYLI